MSKSEFVEKLKEECKKGGAHEWEFITCYANSYCYKCTKCGGAKSEKY